MYCDWRCTKHICWCLTNDMLSNAETPFIILSCVQCTSLHTQTRRLLPYITCFVPLEVSVTDNVLAPYPNTQNVCYKELRRQQERRKLFPIFPSSIGIFLLFQEALKIFHSTAHDARHSIITTIQIKDSKQ